MKVPRIIALVALAGGMLVLAPAETLGQSLEEAWNTATTCAALERIAEASPERFRARLPARRRELGCDPARPPARRDTPRAQATPPRSGPGPSSSGGRSRPAPAPAPRVYAAPARCRWQNAPAAPVLECQGAGGGYQRVTSPALTIHTVDAASRGDTNAITTLGYFYFNQPPPIGNPAEGVRLYADASRRGNPIATYNLGMAYGQGWAGQPRDLTRQRQYLLQAADAGHVLAARVLGDIATAGLSGYPDAYWQRIEREGAGAWYLKAAEGGEALSMGRVARHYTYGTGGLNRNATEAVRWAQAADRAGDAHGRYILGLYMESGFGTQAANPREAYRLFKLAADAGDYRAMTLVGIYLDEGAGGQAQDRRQAYAYFSGAYNQGREMTARYYMGLYNERGLGGRTLNVAVAIPMYREAAEAGVPQAKRQLALLYETGAPGLAVNRVTAARLYREAAEANDPIAQRRYGEMHIDGAGGLPRDLGVAHQWIMRAARQNDVQAMFLAAMNYDLGQGVPRNPDLAIAWYERAALAGHQGAAERLRRVRR